MADELSFSEEQKLVILEQGNYQCIFCGSSKRNGVEVHVEILLPPKEGHKLTIEHGVVVCENHRSDDILGYCSSGRDFFLDLHLLAQEQGDKNIVNFAREIIAIYEEYEIDEMITFRKNDK